MALDKLTKLTTQSGISTVIDYTMSDLVVDTISIGSGGGGIGGGGNINAGIVTCTQLDLNGNADISGNLTVHGDTTTLNTTLREVELLHVDANSSVTAGIITQRGSGDILNLFDTTTEVMTVVDGGKVGINETAPEEQLHITHNTAPGIQLESTAGGPYKSIFKMAGNDTEIRGSSGNLEFYTGNADGDSSTERMRIHSDGRVWINSTSGASATELLRVENDANSSDDCRISVISGSAGEAVVLFGDDQSYNQGQIVYSNVDHSMRLHVNSGNERIRIDSSGRLLVGHTASRNVGNVTSQMQLEGTDSAAGISITRNSNNVHAPYISLAKSRAGAVGGNTIIQDGDKLGEIRFSGADGTDITNNSASIIGAVDGTPGGNDTPGSLTFNTTADGAVAPTERLRIDSSGNVYVGGVGASATAGSLWFNDTSANASKIAQVNGSSALTFHTGSSQPERLRITSAGKLGLGVASPASESGWGNILHINSASAGAHIRFTDNTSGSGAGDGSYIGHYGNDTYLVNKESSGVIIFNTNSAERLRITSAGNLGINNTSPNARIEITDTSTAQIRLGYNATKYVRIGRSSSGTYEFFSQENGSSLVFGTAESSDGGGAEKMRIDRYGNMGLGTNGPTKRLTVQAGSNNADIAIFTGNDLNRGLLISTIAANSQNDMGVVYHAQGQHSGSYLGEHIFKTNNTERLRIDSGGRVLINRTNNDAPGGYASKLQIRDTTYTASISVVRNDPGAGGPTLVFGKSRNATQSDNTVVQSGDHLGQIDFYGADGTDMNSAGAQIIAQVDGTPGGNDMPGRLLFKTTADGAASATERLRINSSGKILIGDGATYNPQGLLHIVGDDNSNGPELYLQVNNNNTTDNIGAILFGNNVDKTLIKLAGHTHTANNTADFTLATSNAGGMSEKLRIKNDGAATFTGSTGATLVYTFQNGTSGASADTKLLVKAYANSGADPYIKFDAGGSDMVVGTKYEGTTNNKLLLGPGASPAGGVTGISIDGSGKTRIGGNSAAATTDLDVVRANSTITDVMLVKGNVGNSFIRFQDNDNSCNWSMGGDDGGGFGANAFIWYDRVAGRYVFSIDGAGQVNVGNARPGSGAGAFNIKTHASVDAFVKFRNASDFGSYTGSAIDCRTSNNVTSRDLVIRSNNLALWNPSAETFRFDANGRLHVGYDASSASGTAAVNIVGAGHGLQIARGKSGSPTTGQDLGSIAFQGYLTGNHTGSADARIDAAAVENHSGTSAGTNLRFWTKQVGTGPGSAPDLWCTLGSHGIFKSIQGVDTQNSNNGSFYTPINTGYVGTQWTEQGAGFVFYMGELASGSSSNASSQYISLYSSHHWGDYPRIIIWAHERYYRTSCTTWTFGCFGGSSPSASLTQTESWGGTNGGHGTDNAGSVSASHQGSVATYSGSAVHRWDLTMSNTGNYGYTRWYIGIVKSGRGIYTSASTASNVDGTCTGGGCIHLKTVNNSQMRSITYLTA